MHVAKLVALLILGVSFLVPTGGSARTDALPRYFDSIVFEGGGVKGAVYAGALVALDEHKVLSNVKKFAGTSAGSTVAALLVVLGRTGSSPVRSPCSAQLGAPMLSAAPTLRALDEVSRW